MSVLQPPYQYVIDSSALFDLKNLYPERIFSGLWERFNDMCAQKLVVAPREVLMEIRLGNDELLDWTNEYIDIFLEPCEAEQEILERVISKYPQEIILKYSTRPWADPLVIACAKYYNLPIIQHETRDSNQCKIPTIASKFDINCIRLVQFFDEQSWKFNS